MADPGKKEKIKGGHIAIKNITADFFCQMNSIKRKSIDKIIIIMYVSNVHAYRRNNLKHKQSLT